MKSFYILAFILLHTTFAFCQPQFLDNTFGDNGVTTASITGKGYTATVQADGKILIGGGSDYRTDGILLRYLPEGNIDSTFGTNGIYNASQGRIQSAKLQSDGKIILFHENANSNSTINRLTPQGTIDSTFGTFGTVTLPWNSIGSELAYHLHIQTDDKIICSTPISDFIRLNADGSLDSTYGNNGILDINVGVSFMYVRNFLIQNDGKLLALGLGHGNQTYNNISIARINTDGSLDTSFGDSGITILPMEYVELAGALAIQNDGSIFANAYSFAPFPNSGYSAQYILAKFDENGKIDSTFGIDGVLKLNYIGIGFGWVEENILTQNNDKVIVAGNSLSHTKLIQYNNDGSIDTDFGIDGAIYLPQPSTAIINIKMLPDEKILLHTTANGSLHNIRLKPTNILNSTSQITDFQSNKTIFKNIYPIPTADVIHVDYELSDESKVTILLINENGQILKLLKNNVLMLKGDYSETFSVADLPQGIYYFCFQNGHSIVTKSFIKM